MSETWAWISGWGIQPERFRAAAESAHPGATHLVFPPDPEAVDALLRSGATHFGGYSLGSLLLLDALPKFPETAPILCVAPVLSFCQEGGLGGKTPLNILEALQAKLAKKPLAALKLFYRLAELPDEPTDQLPYSEESLTWGLEMLAEKRVSSHDLGRVQAILGAEDPLLDPNKLSKYFEHSLTVDSQHSYRTLLAQLELSSFD